MVNNSAILKSTTKGDFRLLCKVMKICHDTHDYIKKTPHHEHLTYECHSISRAIALAVPELRLVDGNYLGMFHIHEKERREVHFAMHDIHGLSLPTKRLSMPIL